MQNKISPKAQRISPTANQSRLFILWKLKILEPGKLRMVLGNPEGSVGNLCRKRQNLGFGRLDTLFGIYRLDLATWAHLAVRKDCSLAWEPVAILCLFWTANFAIWKLCKLAIGNSWALLLLTFRTQLLGTFMGLSGTLSLGNLENWIVESSLAISCHRQPLEFCYWEPSKPCGWKSVEPCPRGPLQPCLETLLLGT